MMVMKTGVSPFSLLFLCPSSMKTYVNQSTTLLLAEVYLYFNSLVNRMARLKGKTG
jgi:hypothetical protein